MISPTVSFGDLTRATSNTIISKFTLILSWINGAYFFGYQEKLLMDRRRFTKLSGLTLASMAAAPLIGKLGDLESVAAAATATSSIALGAYIANAPGDPTQLDAFSSTVGVTPSIVMWYQDWAHSTGFDTTGMNAVSARGAMPMITWEPFDYSMGVAQPNYSLAKIAGGAHDAYITQWAQGAKAYGKPFYLRFTHEMNGNWYPWGNGVNGNTTAQYISAWQHVRAIFTQVGVTNARWIWSPNVAGKGNRGGTASGAFSSFYPGDAYVDWIGMDGYNWGTSQSWSSWQTLATIYGSTYGTLSKMSTKPMMVAEMSSAEVGGSKSGWITTGLSSTILSSYPRIKAVVWFNENKETDWRVNSSASALSAYQQVAKSAPYQGKLT